MSAKGTLDLTIAIPKGALFDDAVRPLALGGGRRPEDAGRKLTSVDADGTRVLFVGRPTFRRTSSSAPADCGSSAPTCCGRRAFPSASLSDLGFGACRLRRRRAPRRPVSRRRATADVPAYRNEVREEREAYFAERDLPVQIIKLTVPSSWSPSLRARRSDRRPGRNRQHVARARSRDHRRDRVVDARFVVNPVRFRAKYPAIMRLLGRLDPTPRHLRIVEATDVEALARSTPGGWEASDERPIGRGSDNRRRAPARRRRAPRVHAALRFSEMLAGHAARSNSALDAARARAAGGMSPMVRAGTRSHHPLSRIAAAHEIEHRRRRRGR